MVGTAAADPRVSTMEFQKSLGMTGVEWLIRTPAPVTNIPGEIGSIRKEPPTKLTKIMDGRKSTILSQSKASMQMIGLVNLMSPAKTGKMWNPTANQIIGMVERKIGVVKATNGVKK